MVTQLLPIILTRGRSTTALSVPKKQMLCWMAHSILRRTTRTGEVTATA